MEESKGEPVEKLKGESNDEPRPPLANLDSLGREAPFMSDFFLSDLDSLSELRIRFDFLLSFSSCGGASARPEG